MIHPATKLTEAARQLGTSSYDSGSRAMFHSLIEEVERLTFEAKLRAVPAVPFIDIVFDGPPGPTSPRFVEVENEKRHSISIGEWINRESGGLWALRIPMMPNSDVMRELPRVLEAAESYQDSGPNNGEGWQSDDLAAACKRMRAALEASPTPAVPIALPVDDIVAQIRDITAGVERARAMLGEIIAERDSAMKLLKDILPELESEAEQRETSGNDENSKGLRVLIERGRALVGG